MLRHQTALVAVAIAGFWPAVAAYPAELAALALAPSEPQGHQQSQSASVQPPSPGPRPEGRSASLRIDRNAIASPQPSANRGRYRAAHEPALSVPAEGSRSWYDRAAAVESSLDDLRDGYSSHPGFESALKLAPSSVMLRTGWNWSGRIGPMRWLGPLDGESGEFKLRLGRVEGQPRPPGLGKFNVSIHYTFE